MVSLLPASPSRPGRPRHPPRALRRRPRSGRVMVAVGLLCLATGTAGVALALTTAMALGAAVLVALVCGWAATRLVHSEVLLAWRDSARDRARQAAAFRDLH